MSKPRLIASLAIALAVVLASGWWAVKTFWLIGPLGSPSHVVAFGSDVPSDAFSLPEVKGVAVSFAPAKGIKCQRSWRYFDPATADPAYPDVTPRDAQALRELQQAGLWKPQSEAVSG